MDSTFLIKEGTVTKALAGRDKGKVFIILKILSEDYVLIVDGKRRTLENPKKKKIKHLAIYKDVIELNVEYLNDSYIRKMLKPYSNEGGEGLWQKKM